MRLLRAELVRLFARRFTGLMLLLLLLTLGVVAAVVASDTHRPSDAELARAEANATAARAECREHQVSEPVAPQPGMGDDEFSCADIGPENFLPYVLDFRQEMPEMLLMLAGLLGLFGYLVGASTVGVEWSSGGMTNLLLWRPRRGRLLLGKLTALTLGVFGIGLALGAAWVGTIWTIARYRGTLERLTDGFWISLGLDGARGLGLALCLTLAGAAIASLGRRTAAALGVVIGYLVVWEIGARSIMMMLRVIPDRYVLSSYVGALLAKVYKIPDCDFGAGDCRISLLTWQVGAGVIGGLTLLTVLVAIWSFRRRDVV